ncbi:MAG: hypothetical protein U5R06_01875 [candidate division KSB1 bacterium]|nr:hypothetical protein [candidate division KSB1 bacterium]
MANKLLLLLILLSPSLLAAQVSIGGGKGLMRIYEADAIEYGRFYTSSVFQGYATQLNTESSLSELYTWHLGFSLGLPYATEVFLHVIPYHDDQRHIFAPPGDTKIGLKHTLAQPTPLFSLAAAGYLEAPTAAIHPIPFEPYSEDGLGWAMLTAASFNFKESNLNIPLKLSLNLGYKDHNISNDVFAGITDQLIGGLAVKYAVKKVLIYSELSGEYFFNKTDLPASYNSVRYTQGVKFYGPYQILFDVAGDIDLSQSKRKAGNQSHRFYEDYADWRIMFGMTYSFHLFYKKNIQELEREQLKEQNINEIRRQRQDINKELEEYRKKLEKEKEKDLPF